jgi:hypothetical protein
MFSYLKKISLQLKNGRKHSRINRQIFHQLNLRHERNMDICVT